MSPGSEEAASKKPWFHLSKLLTRSGPLAHPGFEAGAQNLDSLKKCKVLVIGAGGLGCELLKNLALMGFGNIHVIDMDTIDISNLNRQFLFREKDVGKSKAEVSASFINQRIKSCTVVPHFCKIQDKDSTFYQGFNIVISGLDSVVARRWINGMLASVLRYDDDGNLDTSSIIPLIDGGTEGFKGSARVILLGLSPCIECTLNLYPPQVTYPMCTIAHKPRLPEHCIEYAKMLLWSKEKPFGDEQLDCDNPDHLKWLFEQASNRADEYGIKGVTFRLTQGVVKHIIPAVASTNAIIASSCVMEAFKLVTNCAMLMNNYLNFQNSDGISSNVVEMEKRDDCPICSGKILKLTFAEQAKLKDVIDFLVQNPDYQMKMPAITAFTPNFTTLFVGNIPSIEEQTRPNLQKSLIELGLSDGCDIFVADQTTPTTLKFKLHFLTIMDSS